MGIQAKTYHYILRVTKRDKQSEIQTGTVGCDNFRRAVELALDTESMNWDEKRAARELISLTRSDQFLL